MIRSIIYVLIFVFFLNNCMTAKTCSDQDRTCSPTANLLSILFSGPEGIYIYATNASYQGNLSVLGPSNLDSSLNFLCGQELAFSNMISNSCSKVAPMVSTLAVSVNQTDLLYADFPMTGVPVRGPNGTMVATDYGNLFTLDLEASLEAAGTGNISFWTFSDVGGNYSADNCSDGEDNTSSIFGETGISNTTISGGWFGGNVFGCNQTYKILCMCYVPTSGGG